jgi:ribonuclease HI
VAAEPVRVVAAACDGACRGNPGPGGWGCLLRFEDGSVRELGGAAAATTNNRMELTAALALMEELRQLPLHPDLRLRTDSRYLIDGLTKWMAGWKRKGWRTASGGPVLNRDLWEELDRARLPGLSLVHVKGPTRAEVLLSSPRDPGRAAGGMPLSLHRLRWMRLISRPPRSWASCSPVLRWPTASPAVVMP